MSPTKIRQKKMKPRVLINLSGMEKCAPTRSFQDQYKKNDTIGEDSRDSLCDSNKDNTPPLYNEKPQKDNEDYDMGSYVSQEEIRIDEAHEHEEEEMKETK